MLHLLLPNDNSDDGCTNVRPAHAQLFVTVVTSFAIVAIISVNEYLISSFISGFTVETLPIKIFNNVRYGYTPVLAAAAIGFAAVTVGVLVLVSFFTDLVELFGGSAPEDLR